jgi:hypothetical protein
MESLYLILAVRVLALAHLATINVLVYVIEACSCSGTSQLLAVPNPSHNPILKFRNHESISKNTKLHCHEVVVLKFGQEVVFGLVV